MGAFVEVKDNSVESFRAGLRRLFNDSRNIIDLNRDARVVHCIRSQPSKGTAAPLDHKRVELSDNDTRGFWQGIKRCPQCQPPAQTADEHPRQWTNYRCLAGKLAKPQVPPVPAAV